MALYLTVDVEEPPHSNGRTFAAMRPLIEFLRLNRIRATFFVVGEMIPAWADGLKQLANDGHEIAVHGWRHVHLDQMTEDQLYEELVMARTEVERAVSRSPVGFRAPFFSLTPRSRWVPDVVKEAGFKYSSSVLPALNPQACFPTAPKVPFRWRNGLVELPVPVMGIGRIAIPALGGAYLRLLPKPIVNLASKRRTAEQGYWSYAHPYDFDTDERFERWEGVNLVASRLLFARRKLMMRRFTDLGSSGLGTLEELAAQFSSAAEFDFD